SRGSIFQVCRKRTNHFLKTQSRMKGTVLFFPCFFLRPGFPLRTTIPSASNAFLSAFANFFFTLIGRKGNRIGSLIRIVETNKQITQNMMGNVTSPYQDINSSHEGMRIESLSSYIINILSHGSSCADTVCLNINDEEEIKIIHSFSMCNFLIQIKSVAKDRNLNFSNYMSYSSSGSKMSERWLPTASRDTKSMCYACCWENSACSFISMLLFKLLAGGGLDSSVLRKKKTKEKYIGKVYIEQKKKFSKLSTWEQFIITLVRLRRKITIETLADLFGISTGSTSRIIITWILFLEKELSFLLHFPTLSELDGIQYPKAFRGIPDLRGIIDCTEFYIETPNRLPSQRSTYSTYKSRNTFKLLVSISPIAHFNFVSNLFSGSISDKEIIRQSGFLDKLQPGDAIMADKGFNIQDLLALRETRLIAPPIMRKAKKKLQKKETNKTNIMNKKNVHHHWPVSSYAWSLTSHGLLSVVGFFVHVHASHKPTIALYYETKGKK
ncbi:Hypothetical predicted protein, partial [Paramuricea clavata]